MAMMNSRHLPAILFAPGSESMMAGLTVMTPWTLATCLAPVAVVTAVGMFQRRGAVQSAREHDARKAIKDFIEGR
jgi:hypothetical protein